MDKAWRMLKILTDQIAAACDGPEWEFPQRLMDHLTIAVRDPRIQTDVAKQPDSENYARYLLYEDPGQRFSVFSLVWNSGQLTPPHGHNYWCAYAVISGTITENFYAYDAATDTAKLIETHQRMPGYVCFHEAGLETVHRLSNRGAEPALSLHIYGTTGAETRRFAKREQIDFAGARHINRLVEVA